ncbi:MAG: hypothetical protein ACD_28C00171G0002 [uncultured bacterium]|nr:MAG: hypothetical protein ACD_28C00171G0002 [uncultured bacterium]KKT74064.1 MAG: hypothetical protein UW70_C0068G0017 [Candidatus Peregrinibacteria bacterium GW2011_GWA2_44_7]
MLEKFTDVPFYLEAKSGAIQIPIDDESYERQERFDRAMAEAANTRNREEDPDFEPAPYTPTPGSRFTLSMNRLSELRDELKTRFPELNLDQIGSGQNLGPYISGHTDRETFERVFKTRLSTGWTIPLGPLPIPNFPELQLYFTNPVEMPDERIECVHFTEPAGGSIMSRWHMWTPQNGSLHSTTLDKA